MSVSSNWYDIRNMLKNNFTLKFKTMLAIRSTIPSSINLFDNLFDDYFPTHKLNESPIKNPLHDIIENEEEYVVEMSLAGVKKEDITLNVEYDTLIIKAERKEVDDQKFNKKQTFYGKYEKSFTLPDSINPDEIQASFEDGILKVIIPKIEEKKKIKQIEIK